MGGFCPFRQSFFEEVFLGNRAERGALGAGERKRERDREGKRKEILVVEKALQR